MQKSRSAGLGGLSNAWRRWWATKRRSKLAMGAWIAGERTYTDEKADYGIITNGGPIRGVFQFLTPHSTGPTWLAFFLHVQLKGKNSDS